MSENTAQTSFNCPKCGAPQIYPGGGVSTVECPYCHTTVIVPEPLRTQAAESTAGVGSPNPKAAAMLEIKRLVDNNQKIEAIKLWRETFGSDLVTAKNAVEAIERGEAMSQAWTANSPAYHISSGGQQIDIPRGAGGIQINTTQSGGSGCAGAFVALIILVVIASIVVPILVSVGAFSALVPSNGEPTTIAHATSRPFASVTLQPTTTPRATPTPGFASLVKTIGKQGTAPGQFNDARSIAVDTQGHVYAGEYLSARIQRFDTTGNFQDQWLPTTKTILSSLAADFRGNLYAVENGVIVKFDGTTGKRLGTLSYNVPGDGFDQIALTPDGGLLATWYESRNGLITSVEGHRDDLVRFDRDGKVTQVIKGIVSGQTEDLALNNKLAVDTQGNIYIADAEFANAVFKFSPQGKYINRFGSAGNEKGQWNVAWSIATDSRGRVYVGATDAILVFDATGAYVDTIVEGTDSADDITFDAQDHLWVVTRNTIKEFQLNGK